MKRPLVILSLSLIALIPTPVFASGEVECTASCGEGETMVSYADGNNIGCNCVQSAEMEPTVADPAVVEGEVNPGT